MSETLPERDPLADLVSRSIGQSVPSVEVEVLPSDAGIERKRLRFTTAAGPAAVIFQRLPRGEITEAQLLPFLARRSDRVPRLHSRGLPPAHVTLGPWVLIEDVYDGAPACDGDPVEILDAMRAVEVAVAKDLPALRALGLRDGARELPAALASAPKTLVHGDLVCDNARRLARGVVLVGWRHAFIGPAVLDAATLVRDLENSRRSKDAAAVREASARAGDRMLLDEAERFLQATQTR
ncbi:MAG: phosphotransferase [Chloroflexota bacterium]|nr:phosphotransferase [Chloroflexota bacterium]